MRQNSLGWCKPCAKPVPAIQSHCTYPKRCHRDDHDIFDAPFILLLQLALQENFTTRQIFGLMSARIMERKVDESTRKMASITMNMGELVNIFLNYRLANDTVVAFSSTEDEPKVNDNMGVVEAELNGEQIGIDNMDEFLNL